MESAEGLKMLELKKTERKKMLEHWLEASCGIVSPILQPMVGDASLRRYFRINKLGNSYVVMDAPPPQENCHPYVAIAKALRDIGLNTPEIMAANLEQGFLLITDFGDATFLNTLNSGNADKLYRLALDELVTLHTCKVVEGHVIPPFSADWMWKEWGWYKEWFLDKLLGLPWSTVEPDLDRCYAYIINSAVSQPQVFMHRDYHSANLMVLPFNRVGILDFQDAFIGPVTYDLVSLLRDSYINWPREQVVDWAIAYLHRLQEFGALKKISYQEFLMWFDLMGIQRNLKALLTFARKQVRDHQSQYLYHIPRTLEYLVTVSEDYPELLPLHTYLRVIVQPAFGKRISGISEGR